MGEVNGLMKGPTTRLFEKVKAVHVVTIINGDKANASQKPHRLTKNIPTLAIIHKEDKRIMATNDLSNRIGNAIIKIPNKRKIIAGINMTREKFLLGFFFSSMKTPIFYFQNNLF